MSKFINLLREEFQMVLGGITEVDSLEKGAREFGGATKIGDRVFSNIEGDFVEISDKNVASIFIPSTTNVNIIDKKLQENVANHVLMQLSEVGAPISMTKTQGSWSSDDMGIVIEDITIISIELDDINDDVINGMISLARYVKNAMEQEAVSPMFNKALALV